MPTKPSLSRMSPQTKARYKRSDKSFSEFTALPSSNRPATTTGPSIRNAIYNVKSIPSDFAVVGKKIGAGLSKFTNALGGGSARVSGGKFGRGGSARGKALQMRTK